MMALELLLIVGAVAGLVLLVAFVSPSNKAPRKRVRAAIHSEDDAEVVGDFPRVTTPAKFPRTARVRDMDEPMGM